MRPIETSATPRAVCNAVNRLIGACKDDVLLQDATAADVGDVDEHERLTARSRQRDVFVVELSGIVRDLGGTPRGTGSALERARAAFRSGRAALIGPNDGDAYGACARVEAKAERAYAEVLLLGLPDGARAVVERQHGEIARDVVELRRKTFLR